MRTTLVIALSAMALALSPALAAPSDDFAQLLKDHWAWVLRESPITATSLGVPGADDKLSDNSLAAEDRRAVDAGVLLKRLNAIPLDQLGDGERVSAEILKLQLEEQIEATKYPQRVMLFTTYYGWHQGFAGLADNLPFRSGSDYKNYIARLRLYPAYNDTALGISDQAIAGGYTIGCDALEGYEKSIGGVIKTDPVQSRFYGPFQGDKPRDVTDGDWAKLQGEARQVITTVLNPAYQKHLDWYLTKYKPACAKIPGISAQKGGAAYYAFRVRQETTTDMTPDQIHKTGLSEVARIRSEMETVAKEAGFPNREAMIAELRTNPKYYAKTPDELLKAAAWQSKSIDGMLPRYFGRLPRLTYGVKAIPAEIAEGTTTAYYSPGSPPAGIAGNYYVNTSKLDQRPLWELPALTAHESVPGHHFQIALNQELELPDFRRYGSSFTAYTEGWGLYSEYLGVEMGLYDTPEKKMGRLSYEMWRACRLVVDTGIHAKGWSKAQAVQYMTDNTALTAANIDAEVNRYISWPGQALGYKLGEIKIKELRAFAEKELGDKFSLPAFHDVVLGTGAVPLKVLESEVRRWVAAQKAAR